MRCRDGCFAAKSAALAWAPVPAASSPRERCRRFTNDRDWLRESQRFPVIIGFDTQQDAELRKQLRIGGQASVIAYGKGAAPAAVAGQGLYSRGELAVLCLLSRTDTMMPIGARRAFRLGLVVALSLAVSYGMEDQFPFFAPVFGLLLTAAPAPPTGTERAGRLMLVVAIALGVGLVMCPLLDQVSGVRAADHCRGPLSEYVHRHRARQGHSSGCLWRSAFR